MDEIHAALTGYWENDRWDVYDPFFDDIRPAKWSINNRTMDFTRFGTGIKDEVKFFFAYRLQHKTMRLLTAFSYGTVLNRLAVFLNKIYPHITSLVDIAYDKFLMQWRSYLIDQGFSVDKHGHQLSEHMKLRSNNVTSFCRASLMTEMNLKKTSGMCGEYRAQDLPIIAPVISSPFRTFQRLIASLPKNI